MRTIIHLAAFVFAFAIVSQASAQAGHTRQGRQKREVVYTKPAPAPVVYTSISAHEVRNLRDDRKDLQELVSITSEWNRAVRRHSKRAEAAADRRLHAWLYRELEESRHEGPRDLAKTREIALELRQIDWRFRYDYARPKHYAKKRQLLDELVAQAKHEVERAYRAARTQRVTKPYHRVSYVYAY